ncbi:MAG: thermonuclease family protein [Hyphomicrobiaceae bacterium]
MFGWRRKSDGFEWHEYVRTTIKLRRDDRRKKVDAARGAAASGVVSAGQASINLSRSLVSRILYGVRRALVGCVHLARAAVGLLALVAKQLKPRAWQVADVISPRISGLLPLLSRPGVASLCGLAAIVVCTSALAHLFAFGLHASSIVLGALTLVLLLITLSPSFLVGHKDGSNNSNQRRSSLSTALRKRSVYAMLLVFAAVGGSLGLWAIWPASLAIPSSTGPLAALSIVVSEKVEGRARATSGDTLRIAGKVVVLSGLEAPELGQRCRNAQGRRWRCGTKAKRALQKLVSGRRTVCQVQPSALTSSRYVGMCESGQHQLGRVLVSGGHAFAVGGLFARYGDAERQARNAKKGVWSGNAERPSSYRDAAWERAKRKAPDGCPIKGRVLRRGTKVYVVPWEVNYRRVRIRPRKGERWFCSEQEALSAGFQPALPG